jgi:hypothetical protein
MRPMPKLDEDLFAQRKPLREICLIPEKIISVYTLEQHIWAGEDTDAHERSRALRKPERQTVEEFQINPVRAHLNDILRQMAAPYKPERRDNPIGQGYWIQAEFGSGKSHLLCFLAALALGDEEIWELVRQKEEQAGRGRRESLYRFWEEGLREKSSNGKRGIFVIARTLVGTGGGIVGVGGSQTRLIDYILDSAREQLLKELGKNVSLYPVELLADRFLQEDLERYRDDLRKFLRDPRFFDSDEYEDINDFINTLQSNKSPEYKRHCGTKLWRFYDEYLKMRPHLATETEEVLKHMVETILEEGYSGVLLILDEVSLFMKGRSDELRADDEQTLVVLANRLTRVHNLPTWTVCSAQQAIESKMSEKNIIADDRLKEIALLRDDDEGYYEIILTRVRQIVDPDAIGNYYLYYKKNFSWPAAIGEEEFRRFFPFHRPALEVLRAITAKLTTARSSLHLMYDTLKRQIKTNKNELISLGQLFDKTVNYEEDPSGMSEGLVAVKTTWEVEYNAYTSCERQVKAVTRGLLKVHNDKAIKTLQTLFLYQIARTRQQGITPEEIANAVLVQKEGASSPEENNDYYMVIARNLNKELRQVVETLDEDGSPRYRFDPISSGIDPRAEFQRARDEAEGNEKMQQDSWQFLLRLARHGWLVKTRQMTFDLTRDNASLFAQIAPGSAQLQKELPLEIVWQGRQVTGLVGMRDLVEQSNRSLPLPPLESAMTDHDFAVYISTRPLSPQAIERLLKQRNDPRILIWSPAALNHDELNRLYDLAAYRKLVADWEGNDSSDAAEIINWVARSLESDMGRIIKIIDGAYGRGRIEGLASSNLEFHMGGELVSILTPVVDKVLSAVYESREIVFTHVSPFRKEEAVKVMNGIVRTGEIPRHTKPNQDISAALNFGLSLGIVKRGEERKLDVSQSRFVQEIYSFIDRRLSEDEQTMAIETLYKNFMGIAVPTSYGLTRRMIQLYLLCLVQTGKIRIALAPRAGLSVTWIDYTTIKEIDFSARILDSFTEVQKMAQPRNWEALRPFAEALLDTTISTTYDDAVVMDHRTRLRALFAQEREEALRTRNRAQALFRELGTINPYERVLEQFALFFDIDLAAEEIDQILSHLDDVFGYSAFQEETASQVDVDDFRNRLKNYRDMQRFLTHADELRCAFAYSRLSLPANEYLESARLAQQDLIKRLQSLQPYIDSEALLRAELIGQMRSGIASDGAILSRMISDYADFYTNMHTLVLRELENRRNRIQQLRTGQELQALKVLERISALQPPISQSIETELDRYAASILSCPEQAPALVKEALRQAPLHKCGLSLENYGEHRQHAEQMEEEAQRRFAEAINRKLEIFLTSSIQERLRQGAGDAFIDGLLACTTVEDLRDYLLEKALASPALVTETINRYLKRITVKKIRLADFRPPKSLIEKEQIPQLVQEFRAFLEGQLQSVAESGEGDILPMLEVE